MHDANEDRRQDYRLASGAPVEAVVVDKADRPIALLRDTQVLNVSAGGVAIMTDTEVETGADLCITVTPRMTFDAGVRFKARVLHAENGAMDQGGWVVA